MTDGNIDRLMEQVAELRADMRDLRMERRRHFRKYFLRITWIALGCNFLLIACMQLIAHWGWRP